MTTNFFKKNIGTLSQKDPELAGYLSGLQVRNGYEVVHSKSGHPVLKAGNISLHSLYDPVKDGEKWVESQMDTIGNTTSLVILGMGFGYHILPLLKGQREIMIVEPHPYVLRVAMEHCDLTPILSRCQIAVERNLSEVLERITPETVILPYGPSRYLDPGFFDSTLGRIRLYQSPRPLKIMVVTPIYGGSYPIAQYAASALTEMGHKVELLDFSPYQDALFSIKQITPYAGDQAQLQGLLSNFLANVVMARAMAVKPDLVFFMAQAPVCPDLFKKLKEREIPSAFWFVEDYHLFKYWQEIAPHCDYFFTIQRNGFFNALRGAGVANYHYLPTAASPTIHREVALTEEERKEYDSDISFVGAGYNNRRQFFLGLLDRKFKIWGNEWDNPGILNRFLQRKGARVSTEDSVKIFNATRVNINLHSSTACNGVDPAGDFVNPRTFEIASCGSFQLVDNRAGLSGLFHIGSELITFSDIEDLRGKIDYFLNHPEERREIAHRAQKRALKEHTYRARMEEMLGFLYSRGFQPKPLPPQDRSVDELIAEAEVETDLGVYLSRFRGKDRLTLEDVLNTISEGEGKLSDIEKTFLLMREFKGTLR